VLPDQIWTSFRTYFDTSPTHCIDCRKQKKEEALNSKPWELRFTDTFQFIAGGSESLLGHILLHAIPIIAN
jgi:hypothetical protein